MLFKYAPAFDQLGWGGKGKELTEHWHACIAGIVFVHLPRRHTSSKGDMREDRVASGG